MERFTTQIAPGILQLFGSDHPPAKPGHDLSHILYFVCGDQSEQVEADHLIKEILEKEGKFLKMISRLEKFMLTAQPSDSSPDLGQAISQLEQFMMTTQTSGSRTKRNLLDLLLGPNLGL